MSDPALELDPTANLSRYTAWHVARASLVLQATHRELINAVEIGDDETACSIAQKITGALAPLKD